MPAAALQQTVLMPVFNEIDFDGRVERCAAAVGRNRTTIVYALDSGKPYTPDGFRAMRVRIPSLGPLRMLRPFLFWVGFLVYALRTRPAIIHAHDYFLAFPGWLAARLVRAKFVYDAHELIIPGPSERQRFAEKVFLFLETLVVRRADGVIAASAARAEIMSQHYRLREVPTVIGNVPLIEREAVSDAEDAIPPRVPEKKPGTFRLIYQGYLAERFRIDRYLRAVAALGPRFEIVMAGPGPATESLRALAEHECPGQAFFLGRVPRRFLRDILRTGDAGIIVYGTESLNEIHCAPNKIFEYAQAGLPAIGNANPGLRAIIETADIGVAGDDAQACIAEMAERHTHFRAQLPAFLAANTWQDEEAKLLALYRRFDPGMMQ